MNNATSIVAYLRVSTTRQGQSGLGLDAQRTSVAAYSTRTGLPILCEYVEVETGTGKRDRPQLLRAVKHAKEHGAVIVTAKLDRLARSVAAIVALKQAGVRFLALDLPESENPLFLYIIAAMAEYEAKLISERTKAALAAKRAGGWRPQVPDCWNREEIGKANGERIRNAALARDRGVAGYVMALIDHESTHAEIAERLNDEGFLTGLTNRKTGAPVPFDADGVRRIIKRRVRAIAKDGDHEHALTVRYIRRPSVRAKQQRAAQMREAYWKKQGHRRPPGPRVEWSTREEGAPDNAPMTIEAEVVE